MERFIVMNPARWQQIEQIYHAVLLRPPAERVEFLSSSCGEDEALRAEVESLLSAQGESGDFLAQSDFNLGLRILTDARPLLSAGEAFGSYTILELLGRGGMGEVYLARDARLGRRVALKLLPDHLAADRKLNERFQQEARAAAAISHPQVAHIYEVGEIDGQRYIAMEYVEGVTLRKRLRDVEPLPTVEALKLAAQVAAALGSAHASGIIHRDIKPENIVVRPDGLVKVLDFGLAKLNPTHAATEGEEEQHHHTTTQGLILGTTRYMSPEQARGLPVNARTDVWSLGVVLYEMLCGSPPFDGLTNSDIIAEILKSEPPKLIEPDSKLHPSLRELLRRALSKNPAARYRTAAEMHTDLQHALKEFAARNEANTTIQNVKSAESPATSTAAGRLLLSPRNEFATLRNIVIALAVVASLVGVGLYVNQFRHSVATHTQPAANAPPTPLSLTRITHSGRAVSAAISADAKQLAFAVEEAGRQGIWVRQIDGGATTQIVEPSPTNDFGGVGMAFSPDGNSLYYGVYEKESLSGTLYRVSLRGGAPERLATQIDSPVSFSPDGREMVYLVVADDYERLIIANTDGGEQRTLVERTRPQFISHDGWPSWSPDGQTIAFAAGTRDGKRLMHVVLFDVASRTEKILTAQPRHEIRQIAWLPDSKSLVMTAADEGDTAEHLYRVTNPQGEVTPLTNDFYDYAGISIARHAASLVTVAAEDTAQIWTLEGAENGKLETQGRQVSFGKNDRQGVAWTPDDRLVYGSDASGNLEIWTMAADGSDARQLTFNPAFDTDPDVSPDNRYIVFSSKRAGVYNLWRVGIDGGNPVRLTNGIGEYYPQVSPDGRWIVYHRFVPGDPTAVWKVSIEGGAPVQLTTRPSTRAAVSPDNGWVASTYRETIEASFRIGIYPLAGAPDANIKMLKPLDGAQLFVPLRWSSDGKAIIYVVRKDGVDNLWSHPVDAAAAPRQLTRFMSERIYAFDFSSDGKRLALARGRQNSYVVLMNGAQ